MKLLSSFRTVILLKVWSKVEPIIYPLIAEATTMFWALQLAKIEIYTKIYIQSFALMF
jgi:hypothetical protein